MPNPVIAMAGSSIGSGLLGASAQKKAAASAAGAQVEAASMGIEEQRRQFDAIQQLLAPFVETGTGATTAMANLAGLGGAEAQRAAISGIETSPEFLSTVQQGEEAILSQAAATGGLRGGRTQEALAKFRPAMLSSAIQNQYSRLGGLAGLGQASAAGQASMGQATGMNISNLLQQSGAAQAGAALARGQAQGNLWGGVGQTLGDVFGQAMPSGGIPADQSIFSSWGF